MKKLLHIPHLRVLFAVLWVTLLSLGAWLLVLNKLDPFTNTSLSVSLFFLTFFLSLGGIFTLTLFTIKRWRTQDKVYLKHVTISLRQGLFLSFCANACIALLMIGMLRIWNGLLLVAFMMFVEYYFSAHDEL